MATRRENELKKNKQVEEILSAVERIQEQLDALMAHVGLEKEEISEEK